METLSPCSVPILHIDSSTRASCLLGFHDAQAAAGPTAVALFSMLGLGGGEATVRPDVLEKAHLISSVDAPFSKASGCLLQPPASGGCCGHASPLQAKWLASPLPCAR